MRILSIDIGGTHIKTLRDDEGPEDKRKVASGRDFTPADMVRAVDEMRSPDDYDAVTVGLPTPIKSGRVLTSPVNLGPGWTDFDFATAFHAHVPRRHDMHAIWNRMSPFDDVHL